MDLIHEIDLLVINFTGFLRDPFLSWLMLGITHLGKWVVVFAAAACVSVFFILSKRWLYLRAVLTSVIGAELIVFTTKELIQRARPEILKALTLESDFSFPSGHTIVAFSFYALLAYILYRHEKKTEKVKRYILPAAGILIFLIGFSRIYLGAHWPSDVLLSMLGGFFWVLLIIYVFRLNKISVENTKKVKKEFTYGLIAAWFAFYIYYFLTHGLVS